MVITYYGEGCFRFQSGETSFLVDPENNRLKADVYLKTLISTSDVIPTEDQLIFPGEYEMKGVEVRGVGIPPESTSSFLKTAYLVTLEGIKILLLGHLSQIPDADIVGEFDEPDIVVVPVGGGHFLSPKDASKLMKQIEPAIVIPSFYKNLSEFFKEFGHKAELEEKFVFKRKDLEGLENKVVALEAKSEK